MKHDALQENPKLEELKEKRREAARRSRLRKRALMESMEEELQYLRDEVARLSAERDALMAARTLQQNSQPSS